jgi:hypothetical protein
MESEAKPKYIDNYGRQAEIRKAHSENIETEKELIGAINRLTNILGFLIDAVNEQRRSPP